MIKILSLALLSIVLAASTCYASSDIYRLEKLFLEGRYDSAVHEAENLISSRSRQRDEVYYLKGLSELKMKKFQDARQSFGNILDKYPLSDKAFDAYVGLGDTYFLEGKPSTALKEYNEALSKFPKDSNKITVYSRMSNCYAKLGDKPKEDEYSKKAKGFDIQASNISEARPKDVPRGELSYASIQVGCFKNKKNAEKLMRKLRADGFEAYVEIPAGSGDKLYRVKAGRFESKASVEMLAAKLKARGYSTKIC